VLGGERSLTVVLKGKVGEVLGGNMCVRIVRGAVRV
jgi:hypothetical protein